ncbi:MAG: polymer-forming cytoskeletal protein [Anaerolineales bacterium]|nr:polymer-forming cytoskeletal protein [Anaerolineales bacterium]
MFTFRPGKNGHRNGHGGNGQGKNGHTSLNGNGYFNGGGNGHHAAIESVIGPGINWKGDLTGAGGLRIEGSFEGNIKITGPLVVAEGAKVTAETIYASAVSVAGTIKANIVADKVELLSTGRVYGDLTTSAFASEEGAFLRGQITMQEASPILEELSGVQPNVA